MKSHLWKVLFGIGLLLDSPSIFANFPSGAQEATESKSQLRNTLISLGHSSQLNGIEKVLSSVLLSDLMLEQSPKAALQHLLNAEFRLSDNIRTNPLILLKKAAIFAELGYDEQALQALSPLLTNSRLTPKFMGSIYKVLLGKLNKKANKDTIWKAIRGYGGFDKVMSFLDRESFFVLLELLDEKQPDKYQEALESYIARFFYHDSAKGMFSQLINSKAPSFAFLEKMRFNAYYDNGLRDWLAISIPNVQAGSKGDKNQPLPVLEDFLGLRLVEKAWEFGQTVDANTIANRYDRARFLDRMFDLSLRFQEPTKGLRFISQIKRLGFDTNEKLAQLLSYNGLHMAAFGIYDRLSHRRSRAKFGWQAFWSLVRADEFQQAVDYYKNCHEVRKCWGSSLRVKAAYWYSYSLSNIGRNAEAGKVLEELMGDSNAGFYHYAGANLFRVVEPDKSRVFYDELKGLSEENLSLTQLANIDTSLKLQVQHAGLFEDARSIMRFYLREYDDPDYISDIGNLSARIGFYSGSEKALGLVEKLWRVDGNSYRKEMISLRQKQGFWMVRYPRAFREIVKKVAEKNRLDEYLLYSLMRAESYYDPTARSNVGAKGVLQIMPYTAYKIAKEMGLENFTFSQLSNPAINIPLSGFYFRKLLDHFGQNYLLACAAYNAGPQVANLWLQRCQDCDALELIESISYRETRNYVKKIARFYHDYRWLYLAKKTELFPKISGVHPQLVNMY